LTEEISASRPAWMNLEEESWGADPGPVEKQPDPHFTFYNGEVTIYFNIEDHEYYKLIDAEKVPVTGVTTALGVINKPFLKQWAVKQALLVLRAGLLTPAGALRTDLTVDRIAEIFEEARFAHKTALNNAGDIGTVAHDAIEQAINTAIAETNGVMLSCPIADPKHPRVNPTEEQVRMAQNCANAAFKWVKEHNVRFIRTERKVYSREYNYCGTLDGEAIVDSCTDPLCKGCRGRVFKDRHSLLDWKSSNQLSTDYAWQVAAYLFAHCEEFQDVVIQDRWILRLGKEEGDFEPWFLHADTFESDFDAFIAFLEGYKQKNAIEDRRAAENSEWSAVVREGKKAITADNNVARKELYKKLRGEGMSVDEADSESRKQYPVREVKRKPKEEKPEEKPIEQLSVHEQCVLQAIEQVKQVTTRLPVVESPVVESPVVEAPAAAPTPKPTGLPTIRRTSRPA
jgi:hypothetical protein